MSGGVMSAALLTGLQSLTGKGTGTFSAWSRSFYSLGHLTAEKEPVPFPSARRHGCYSCFALLRYSPVRVSTWIISPIATKGGTVTLRPVSQIAGLYCAAAVAPFTDGSVSTTLRSTV